MAPRTDGNPVALDLAANALTLTLQDKSLLFRGPGLDPMRGVHDARSGMEWITDALMRQLRGRHAPLRTIRICLPASQLETSTAAELQAAIRGHCTARIDEADRALAALRQAQRVALQMGLLFLCVCLLLSTLSGQMQALPPFLRRLATEGFLIAGWVGMWRPLELLLFDWWPHVRQKKLHVLIRRMTLVVAERTTRAAHA